MEYVKGQKKGGKLPAAAAGRRRLQAAPAFATLGKLFVVIVILELLRVTLGGSVVRSIVRRSAAPADDAVAQASRMWTRAVLAPLPEEAAAARGKQRPDYVSAARRRA